MDLYLLGHAVADSGEIFAQLPQHVVGADRKSFYFGERELGPGEVRKGLHVRNAGDAYLEVRPGRHLADLLTYTFSGSLILRHRVVEKMAAEGVRAVETAFRWSLHIVEPKSRKIWDEYIILWPLERHDVLDHGRAKVRYYPGTQVIWEIEQWAINLNAVPEADLFPAEDSLKWICTAKFRSVIEKHRFSGFDFAELT